jgi:hypothetical protein
MRILFYFIGLGSLVKARNLWGKKEKEEEEMERKKKKNVGLGRPGL